MNLTKQFEIYRLQTPDIIRVFDPNTQTFTRLFDRFQACTQEIVYDPATGLIIGTSPGQIIDIPLDAAKVKPTIQPLVSQIVALVTQLHPLVAQVVVLQSQDSVSDPESVTSA